MQSLDIAHHFAKQVGWSSMEAMSIPSWYFKEERYNKEFALYIFEVCAEARSFYTQYSDRVAGELTLHFPNLSKYIMEGQKVGNSVLVTLGLRYKMSTPLLNLNALISEVETTYRPHLMWAKDPERYETIIDGIRAETMVQAMDLEKSSRYATGFQNRILKGFQAMAAMDQHEHAKALIEQERSLSLSKKGAAKQGVVIDEEESERVEEADEPEQAG